MPRFRRCDGGCGKESPDAAGGNVANSWLHVRAGKHLFFYDKDENDDVLFCPECAAPIMAALKIERIA